MSMVMMPLLIKVKMTEENFKDLLSEAARMYYRSYLRKYYRYDGTYFTLDLCGIDNPGIYAEAKRIARFTDCENEVVGLIYNGGPSYSIAELVFSHGVPCFKAHTKTKYSDLQAAYLRHKEIFLNKFPASSGNQYDISQYIPASSIGRHYTCEAMTQDSLEGLFETNGYHVEEISTEDRHVEVCFYDCDDSAEDIPGAMSCCILHRNIKLWQKRNLYAASQFSLTRPIHTICRLRRF